jgi:LEA14-like dessication related protein
MIEKLNKKNGGRRCGILFLFILPLFLVSCLGWILEKPSFVLREIALSPRSLIEMNLLLGLDVQNPNRFDLTLISFEYTVYLNNEEIGKGRLEKEILIPSSSITRVQAPVAASFKNLGGSLMSIFAGMTGKEVSYKIEGKAEVKTFFGSFNFPFSKEGRIQ